MKESYLNDPLAPHRNKLLKNLRGEEWKEIPGTEGYYQISNYGRVKSMPRLIEVYIPKQQRSITYYTKEKILTVKVLEHWNSIINKPYYDCGVSIRIGGKERRYQIGRLVYHAFIKAIDFETDQLMIMHKDENGLNNYYRNLVAGLRSAVTQRSYNKKRHISPFALKSEKEMKQISRRAVISRQKPVIQFSLKGKRIKRYASIKKASVQTGIPDSNISNMLKGNLHTAGGYLWEYDIKRV